MTPLNTGVAVVTLLNGVVAAAILLLGWRHGRLRRKRTEFVHILMALAAVGLLGLIERVVLRQYGFNFFGLIRVVYVQVVVLLPALGVVLLIHRLIPPRGARRPRASRAVVCAALLALPLGPFGAYASLIEPHWLSVERVDVPLPAIASADRPIRVGVLADIQTEHVTDWERRAVAALMAESPDLILITGDLLQVDDATFAREAPAMQALLNTLSAPAGVFAVQGDCDPRGRTRRLYKGTGIPLLVNNTFETTCGGQRIVVGGCERDYASRPARRMLDQLAARAGDGTLRIVMAHDPSVVQLVAENDAADLVVAGHTHGGQIRLPGIGPVITATELPRANCAGLSEYKGVPLYVSRGVGMVRAQAPPIRFLCRPEVSVLTLHGPAGEPSRMGGDGAAR